ncbi:uncharacterized protein [Anabrus simplex]|uniref:uncharacterized protein isoform X2 n=1 Tax=Anabrus simplex TaxID=316456 RepID=UPI0035A374BF
MARWRGGRNSGAAPAEVSPGNSTKRSHTRKGRAFLTAMALRGEELGGRRVTTATQTTLPKTRHQRPFGWDKDSNIVPFRLQDPPPPQMRFGSLPYDGALQLSRFPPPWLPPRTVPGVVERHREVRRRGSDDPPGTAPSTDCTPEEEEDRANFSDDSLEQLPVPANKRSSIAWEVPLDDTEALLTPGSTKVIGRRRRRSGDHSSTSSIHRLRDQEEWPDPPVSTEDEAPSPFSDSYYDSSATNELDDSNILPSALSQATPNGTYVIRKGRKKERKPVTGLIPSNDISPQQHSTQQPKFNDLKRCSSTFDNIKSLLKEGLLEGLDDAPPDFKPPTPPGLVRVVSLPSLSSDETQFCTRQHDDAQYRSKPDVHRLSRLHELAVTMEEEEDLHVCSNLEDFQNSPCQVIDLSVTEEEKLIEQLEKEHLQSLQNKHNDLHKTHEENGVLSSDVSPEKNNSLNHGVILHVKENPDFSMKRITNHLSKERLTNGLDHKGSSCLPVKQEMAREENCDDPWLTATEISQVQVVPVVETDAEAPPEEVDGVHLKDNFKITVDVLQHEFPPLPPSPVEEDDDEYSEILHPSPAQTPRGKADTLPEPFYRSLEPPGSDPSGRSFLNRPCPPEPPPHHEPMSSLKTRSMDAGFSRGHRNHGSGNRREIPSERRTLPSELPGPLRRRTFQKRSAQSPREETLQTSCSLPETPIFARGCDIPRTPHRRAPDVPSVARTAPRPGGLATGGYRRTATSAGHGTTVGLGSGGLGQALVGAELLRLAGGPGRGWYPRHRQQNRPASIERLDRLAPGHSPGHTTPGGPWDTRDTRKPLTLPPNLSPKFFHRSPREALRRVTSLLIRKGGSSSSSSKDTKRDALSPTGNGSGEGSTEGSRQKRGFFKSFWKRSRHYSLEHQ